MAYIVMILAVWSRVIYELCYKYRRTIN